MIKVLHVIPSLGPSGGGPSLALPTMARGLAQAGVTVHIVTTDDNGPDRLSVPLGQPLEKDGYTTWYFPRQTRFYNFSWPLTRWLANHIRDYDIVHIHALFSYAALPAAWYAWRAGVPYIVRPLGVLNQWGMQDRRPLLKRLSFALIEQHILARAALVHFTSQPEQAEAKALGVVKASAVIPLGVDLPTLKFDTASTNWYRSRFPALAGRTIALFLSRLDPKKGLDLLLEAFAQTRSQAPNLALVLAGDGHPTFIAHLRERVDQLGLTADVFWAGFIANADKAAALAEADFFVLPSYSENYGIAVVEALASSLPVIISDQVGLSDEVTHNQAGLVVPCEVTPLAQALLKLAADPSLRQQLGYNGQRLAHDRYSLDIATRRLIEAYNSLIPVPVHSVGAAVPQG